MNCGRAAKAGIILAACLLGAVLLECCTLIGAPLASPFVLSDWNLRRIAVFVCILLFVYGCWRLLRAEVISLPSLPDLLAKRPAGRRLLVLALCILAPPVLAACAVWLAVVVFAGASWDARYGWIPFLVCLSASMLVTFRRQVQEKLERGFLMLALPIGMLMCLCMPVLAEVSWDGQIHFNSALAMSYIFDAEYTAADQVMVDAYAVERLGLLESGDVSSIWNPKQDTASVARAEETLLALDGQDIVVTEGTSRFSSSSYVSAATIGRIPNAVGLWLGRLLHLTCLGQYLLARMMSMLFYCLVFYLGIRQLRSGKLILAALALLPTPMLMAANFSYDPWCFALISFAFATYVGSLQRQEPMTWRRALIIYGAFFLGALVKAVLFPLALVFFVAPRSLFTDSRASRLFRAGAVLTVLLLLASFALPFLSSPSTGGDSRGGSDVSSSGQIAFILSSPLSYLGVLLNFSADFLNLSNATSILNTFSGFPYLVSDTSRVAGMAIVEWVILGVVTVTDRGEEDLPYAGLGTKAAVAVGAVCAYLLVVTALYVSFTAVASDTVAGVQYRYLLPFLAPVFLVGCNFGTSIARRGRWLGLAFCAVELVALCVTIINMFVLSF